MYNSLTTNFVTKKRLDYEKHCQTLSNNLQNAVDLSFQAIEPLELNFKKEISKKESSKRVEKIAPRFKAAKEVLTQDEKAYIDRLTQALTYNFLYAQ